MTGAEEMLNEHDGGDIEVDDSLPSRDAPLPSGLGNERPALPPLPENDYNVLDEPAEEEVREAPLEESSETLLGERETERAGRESRKERRQRQKDGKWRSDLEIENLREQVAQLQGQIQSVNPRFAQIDVDRHKQALDGLTRGLQEQINIAAAARKALSEAVVAGDAERVTQALETRDQAFLRGQNLAYQKNQVEQALKKHEETLANLPREAGLPQAPPPLPPRVMSRLHDFLDDHPWYKVNSTEDLDSNIVRQIDAAVAAEGYRTDSDEYWDELRDRVKQYLPQRFERAKPAGQTKTVDARQTPPQRRGPATAAPAAQPRAAQGGRQEVALSRERKEALINAGILGRDGRTVENKERFARVLKQYQQYDKENARR